MTSSFETARAAPPQDEGFIYSGTRIPNTMIRISQTKANTVG
jgi:hypothetical protein